MSDVIVKLHIKFSVCTTEYATSKPQSSLVLTTSNDMLNEWNGYKVERDAPDL